MHTDLMVMTVGQALSGVAPWHRSPLGLQVAALHRPVLPLNIAALRDISAHLGPYLAAAAGPTTRFGFYGCCRRYSAQSPNSDVHRRPTKRKADRS